MPNSSSAPTWRRLRARLLFIAVVLLGLTAFLWNGYIQELNQVKIAAATAVESQNVTGRVRTGH